MAVFVNDVAHLLLQPANSAMTGDLRKFADFITLEMATRPFGPIAMTITEQTILIKNKLSSRGSLQGAAAIPPTGGPGCNVEIAAGLAPVGRRIPRNDRFLMKGALTVITMSSPNCFAGRGYPQI